MGVTKRRIVPPVPLPKIMYPLLLRVMPDSTVQQAFSACPKSSSKGTGYGPQGVVTESVVPR